jgi:hypothetical protein
MGTNSMAPWIVECQQVVFEKKSTMPQERLLGLVSLHFTDSKVTLEDLASQFGHIQAIHPGT